MFHSCGQVLLLWSVIHVPSYCRSPCGTLSVTCCSSCLSTCTEPDTHLPSHSHPSWNALRLWPWSAAALPKKGTAPLKIHPALSDGLDAEDIWNSYRKLCFSMILNTHLHCIYSRAVYVILSQGRFPHALISRVRRCFGHQPWALQSSAVWLVGHRDAGQQMGSGVCASRGQSAAMQAELGRVCHQPVTTSEAEPQRVSSSSDKVLLRTQQHEGKFLLAHRYR